MNPHSHSKPLLKAAATVTPLALAAGWTGQWIPFLANLSPVAAAIAGVCLIAAVVPEAPPSGLPRHRRPR